MPYPGFGMRSTSVVFGCSRATDTGMNRPLPELRPRKLVLLVFLLKVLTSFAGTPHEVVEVAPTQDLVLRVKSLMSTPADVKILGHISSNQISR